jgi:hypothetical protein
MPSIGDLANDVARTLYESVSPSPSCPSPSSSGLFSWPDASDLRLDDFSVRNGPDLFVYLSWDPDG